MNENKTTVKIKIAGCTVTYWKHTMRIILPSGDVFWMDSYNIITEERVREKTATLLKIFEAGKKEQCALFRKMLGIK